MWPLSAWLWLRTTVNLSAMAAHFWQCSVKNVPGTLVGIVLNGPRISGGASGFGSPLFSRRRSVRLGVPHILLRRAPFQEDEDAGFGLGPMSGRGSFRGEQVGQREPSE